MKRVTSCLRHHSVVQVHACGFVLEPLFLHRRFIERARRDPIATFALVARMHWILLILSLITITGAVAGSHGYLLFVR